MNQRNILVFGLGFVLGFFFYNNRKRTLINGSEVKIDVNADCEKKWESKADKGAIGATLDARKQDFMYRCVNNITPQVIMN